MDQGLDSTGKTGNESEVSDRSKIRPKGMQDSQENSKNTFSKTQLLGNNFWIRFPSAIIFASGFYAAKYVVELTNKSSYLSYKAGIVALSPESPPYLLWLDSGIGSEGFLSLLKPIYILGIICFFVILYLPVVSARLDKKIGTEYIAWTRGSVATIISIILTFPVTLTPYMKPELIFFLLAFSMLFGIITGLYQQPLESRYVAIKEVPLESKLHLLNLDIRRHEHLTLLFLSTLLAFGIGALLGYSFSTPYELSRLPDIELTEFIWSRSMSLYILIGYFLIGITAVLLNGILRVYSNYRQIKTLVLPKRDL